jgi:sucrose-6-phosphate hydrolase SacC (GH32 family)
MNMSEPLEAGGERFRPQWHFTTAKHWINDPNGLVWFDGEYHLFYQHNPFGDQWGHMSWGHAVSTDLLTWKELPVAIPEDERVSIFSGSIVVDTHNTSGFAVDGMPVLVAIYTGCRRVPEGGQAQEIAWSNDRGRTWTKYTGNPVLDIGLKDFRDPKVFWHAPTSRWVMAVVRPFEHKVSFYASGNLREWIHLSDFGPAGEADDIWECPDLIEFAADDGKPMHSRWLLKVDTFSGHPGGTGGQYFIGQFDGTTFTAQAPTDNQGLWTDQGSDFYASLSWANLPAVHKHPVWIGWMSNHQYVARTPTSPWRGAMTVPRELFIRETQDGPRLGQRPIPALALRRGVARTWREFALTSETAELELWPFDGRSIEIEWVIEASDAQDYGLAVRCGEAEETVIGVDAVRGVVYIDRSRSGFVPDGERWSGRREAPIDLSAGAFTSGSFTLRVLVDRCSVEVFSGDGAVAMTELVFPSDASRGVKAFAEDGSVQRSRITVWPLKP